MTSNTKKILVATDLSQNSAYALQYAMQCAKCFGSVITILHVMEAFPESQRYLLDIYLDEEQKKSFDEKKDYAKDRIKMRLKQFCDKKFSNDPLCCDRVDSIEVREGNPADEILKVVAELNCDAIVMGSHGRGIISHAILGAVAEKVIRGARKPVFIIPLPSGETELTFHDI